MKKEDILQFLQSIDKLGTYELDLSNKEIEEIPNEIGEFSSLKRLNLSYNSIKTIPESICDLENLEELLLLRNDISKLPAGFGKLEKLKILDVSYNPIVKLPNNIGLCSNLEFLDASYCELRTLPIELIKLLSLKTLNLEENPLVFPQQKVIKRGLYAIMHFLGDEFKKKEASKVMIQVFNLPEKVQGPFRDYMRFFNKMISKANDKEMLLDVNFVNQEFYKEMEISSDVESYLFDVMRYIQQKIDQVKTSHSDAEIKELYIESRMTELKEQLFKFNSSLDDKIDEIKHMKNDLTSLFKLLDE